MKKRENNKDLIQNKILIKLAKGNDLRFSDILVKDIDSNLFTYHLKKLKTLGLLSKNGLKYNLTVSGKKYIDTLSMKSLKVRQQPKIATIILCKNKSGNYLLQKRNKHPHFGKFGFIYGKIHFGENVANAAKRELKEKTNFDLEPVHSGEVYIIEKNKTEIINHTLFHVFLISNLDDNLMVENIFGEFIWDKVEDIKEGEKIPGTEEIKNMVEKSKNNFFAEITIGN